MTATKRTLVALDNFPAAAAYFFKHRKQLESRKYLIESGRKWYEIRVPQNPAEWAAPKTVWPDISKEPRFFLDTSGAIVGGDGYWVDLWIAEIDPDDQRSPFRRDPLIQIALRSVEPEVQGTAIHFLALMKDVEALKRIIVLLDRRGLNPGVRAAVIDCLSITRNATFDTVTFTFDYNTSHAGFDSVFAHIRNGAGSGAFAGIGTEVVADGNWHTFSQTFTDDDFANATLCCHPSWLRTLRRPDPAGRGTRQPSIACWAGKRSADRDPLRRRFLCAVRKIPAPQE